jgi:lipopolysaccharide transport system ATP-binding protein
MSELAIGVEDLSKSYLLGHKSHQQGKHSSTLRDVIAHEVRGFARNAIDVLRGRQVVQGDEVEEFWALKDVSFEVKQGEALGIIGRNGSGKSTLLKILSRITEPTKGRITLRGRVSSLLEVGTGFHPELTGRENIFLNGAILGMTQREIRKKYDEIVAFADVEKFLDTPVKRYSSGMFVRLAFAVAAHLEPEILIVDEVLAVGDAEFQQKCLGKMDDVARREGRTVLFVSHNIEAILKLCSRAVLLNSGRVVVNGPVKQALGAYLDAQILSERIIDLSTKPRRSDLLGNAKLFEIAAGDNNNWAIDFGEPLIFEILVESSIFVDNIELGIGLFSARGFEAASWTNKCSRVSLPLRSGRNVFRVEYQDMAILPGQYTLGIGLRSGRGLEDYLNDAVQFEVRTNEKLADINANGFGGVFIPRVAVSNV